MEDKAPMQDINDPMATIVITMNLKTGNVNIAGNVLADKLLSMQIMIEALHALTNRQIQ
jgi:hypothetical protein